MGAEKFANHHAFEPFTTTYSSLGGWQSPLPKFETEKILILAFASPKLSGDAGWTSDLKARYPHAKLIGCSTAGEICGNRIEDGVVSVAAMPFQNTELKTTSVDIAGSGDSYVAGEAIARHLERRDLKGVLVFSDGLNVNGTALVRGLKENLPSNVVITGGLAGDGANFSQTWVLYEGKMQSHRVVAAGLYGEHVRIRHGSQGGWDIFGPERVITRSDGNILYELDGELALDLYKHYLGARSVELPASGLLFPLQVRPSEINSGDRLVRTILSVDEKERSLIFAGDVPTGWRAQLMRANFDRLVEGASNAAAEAGCGGDRNALAIAVSCVGRRLVLQDRAEDEVEATLERLPKGTKQIGFYSYGEICPQGRLASCELHNQTMTLTVLSESACIKS